LFDLDGNGNVSLDEFEKIMNFTTSELNIGKRMGISEADHVSFKNTGLNRLFFGPKGTDSLDYDKFTGILNVVLVLMT
jgi:Ca2+-binding EF-hand superfamily protein